MFKDHDKIAFKDYLGVWTNNGVYAPESQEDGNDSVKIETVSMTDALSHPNSTTFFPMVIETMVREAAEPMLIGSQLLQRINYVNGLQMTYPSVGAITAEDIGESGEYPEYTLNFGTGSQIITIGKSGLAIKYTDEMKRYSQYDMLSWYLKAMGRALARLKESKIWAMFSAMGVVTHNNLDASGSIFGTTSGYDSSGSANGSVTMDNIYEAYTQVLANGYIPDTVVVHPLAFAMFLTDPVMRTFATNFGGGSWYNGWMGNAKTEYPWDRGLLGKLGPGPKSATEATASELINSAKPKFPDYLGIPLKILVSPFVPFNKDTKVTDIYMVDSSNVGALIVDEEPTMEEIPDRLRDITKIKIRERYAIAPYDGGNAVAVIKNVKAEPNKLILPVQPTLTDFTEVDRTQNLSFS